MSDEDVDGGYRMKVSTEDIERSYCIEQGDRMRLSSPTLDTISINMYISIYSVRLHDNETYFFSSSISITMKYAVGDARGSDLRSKR